MASSARIDELRKKFEENPRRYFAPLANEYRKAGDVEQAISICREYLPQQPGHMSGHIVYGQALYEARQFDEAKTVFETALALDPENLIALRHLGDIALIIGDSNGARSWYRRVLDADPRNEEIQAQLATLEKSETSAAAPEPEASTTASSPTPAVASLVVPEVEKSSDVTPAIGNPVIPEPAAAGPDASTAETVVIPAVTIPSPGNTEPPAPVIEHLPVPDMPAPDAVAPVAALELESPVAGTSAETVESSAPLLDSFSLAGLETTSLTQETASPSTATTAESPASAGPPDAPSLSTAPTLELDLKRHTPSSLPAVPSVSAPEPSAPARFEAPPAGEAAQAPPPVSDVKSADSPTPVPELLDLTVPGTPVPLATSAVAELPKPETSPSPNPETAPSSAPPENATPKISAPESATPDVPAAVSSETPKAAPAMDLPFVDLGETTEPEPVIPAPNTGPFVTETMAELYLRQGHRDEALRVYKALLQQRPGDAALQARIAELEPRPAPPPAARTGPSIRDLLGIVARRRPGSGGPSASANGGPAAQPSMATSPEPTATAAAGTRTPEPASAAPAARESASPIDARSEGRTDGLSALFGNAAPSPADESAARSLALAFAGANGSGPDGVGGAPARRASDELSLDSVFGGDTTVAPEPASFSFDQFFSRRAATEEMPTPTTAAGDTEAASPDEIAHFTKWLEGLKQK